MTIAPGEDSIKRIIISTKNEVGVIAGITAALAEGDVNIQSLDTEGVGDHGMVIITTDDDDGALLALSRAGYRAVAGDALIVRLRDEPGALAQLSARFRDAGVNIQSMHILNRHGGHATIALSADDLELASGARGRRHDDLRRASSRRTAPASGRPRPQSAEGESWP